MQYRKLGRSDLFIGEIGFGCMSLELTNNENEGIIHQAIESGINFFDTADIYHDGENEICLGKSVKHCRDKIFIATKAGNKIRDDGNGFDWDAGKKHILSSIEKSLKRLQTDYVDLYQLHGGMIEDNIDETIEAFEILKQQGKIRYYGISSIRPDVIREYVARSNIVSAMMQYSLLDRRPEENCFALLEKNNIGVLARGSVAKGLLIDKQPENYLGYSANEVSKLSNAIAEFSDKYRSPAQSAIQFVLDRKVISSAIVGIRTLKQLEEAIEAVNSPRLTNDQLEYLRNLLPVNYYKSHR